MKKFLLVIALIFAFQSSFSQSDYEPPIEMFGPSAEIVLMTPTQIANIIKQSESLNKLKNPDLIFPGDTIRFWISGFIETFITQQGDNLTKMLKNYHLSYTDRQLRYLTAEALEFQKSETFASNKIANDPKLPVPWFAIIGLVGILFVMVMIYLILRKYSYL